MNPITQLKAKLPSPLRRLADLAYNYWWSWTPDRMSLFSTIEPTIWQNCYHNPVALIEAVSYERLSQIAEDPHYLKRLQVLANQFDTYMRDQKTWGSQAVPDLSPEEPVAYFCLEYGLHESLYVYCGGLGVLAGDYLKSASDLGVPMVGVGLLYKQGYVCQRLNRSGWQEDFYRSNDFDHMPLELVRDEYGQPVTVKVTVRQRTVRVQAWKARVGRVDLYLLDADRSDNDPIDRKLTGQLYSGNRETRLAQQILLGIGGVQLLHTLEIEPAIYHINEGSSAFALLEVVRQEMEYSGSTFEEARNWVRDRSVFTTHTPVSDGNDAFSADMMDSFFGHYWPQLELAREEFLHLGARRIGDPWEPFSLTVLALRLTRQANGVSRRHGEVSRQMWQILYPDQAQDSVPIGYVTNGAHLRSWTAPLLADLYGQYLGHDWAHYFANADRWSKVDLQSASTIWHKVDSIPDRELWHRHCILKERLIAYTRARVLASRLERKEAKDDILAIERLLDPNVLTLGFARRFSPYKRGALLFKDLQQAIRIFSHARRPIQIIFAGKARSGDDEGKRIIQRLMEWCRHPALRDRVAFIEDYDMFTAKLMVHGVDVWLNTPRRPTEACGTSGQKAAFNGVINCSVLDGWWCEAYQAGSINQPANGWVIGEAVDTSDQELQDQIDADALYTLLERDITPLFYDRDRNGIPHKWIAMMKASIRTNAPNFNSDRMVSDYVTQAYRQESAHEMNVKAGQVA
ncbi:alpha-glucan family phosphorylase [Oscillatoria sp. CS-180]|uniref:alpha-glucan family phosphorylase n=1 Tax=Oscillatoria sp. CS-180 TaxID=3021720 RepID=UPI00232ABC51|nr:alpha-glucan family phosphorylase [Oscillatoria sp. CS-180]MDB9527954.1 alpha-glucan family phosphorylase [Oscillatoria sp. CS-180]